MAGRKKGTKKTGGRQKGTPNRITGELKTEIKNLLEKNFKTFEADLKNMEPEKRAAMFEKLLKYAVPIQKETDLSFSIDKLTNDQIDQLILKLTENDRK